MISVNGIIIQYKGNTFNTAKQGSAGAQPGASRELYTVSGDGIFARRRLLFIDIGNALSAKNSGAVAPQNSYSMLFYAANLSAKNIIICP